MEKIRTFLTGGTGEWAIRYQVLLTQEELNEVGKILKESPQMDQMEALRPAYENLKTPSNSQE